MTFPWHSPWLFGLFFLWSSCWFNWKQQSQAPLSPPLPLCLAPCSSINTHGGSMFFLDGCQTPQQSQVTPLMFGLWLQVSLAGNVESNTGVSDSRGGVLDSQRGLHDSRHNSAYLNIWVAKWSSWTHQLHLDEVLTSGSLTEMKRYLEKFSKMAQFWVNNQHWILRGRQGLNSTIMESLKPASNTTWCSTLQKWIHLDIVHCGIMEYTL